MESLQTIGNYDLRHLLLGKGSGGANTYIVQGGSTYEVYVENFFISLLNDYGIVFSTLLITLQIVVFILTALNKSTSGGVSFFAFVFTGILLTNLLASNLTMFTVQIIYWVVFFASFVRESGRVHYI